VHDQEGFKTDMVRKTGIMADSHGQPETIQAALRLFREKGCDRFYHLGDICDTRFPETADACVHLLQESHVNAVKGNNDHIVVVNHKDRPDTPISPQTLDYLANLPQRLADAQVFFTHSLPFVEELGAASMVWSMGIHESERFFEEYPCASLFRGHSHNPEIMFQKSGKVIVRTLSPGQQMDLSDKMPFVITCGALMASVCMIWEPDQKIIQSLSF